MNFFPNFTMDKFAQMSLGQKLKHQHLQIGKIFRVGQTHIILSAYLGAGLTPYGQIVGSLLIPPGWQKLAWKDLSKAPMDLTNSDITTCNCKLG